MSTGPPESPLQIFWKKLPVWTSLSSDPNLLLGLTEFAWRTLVGKIRGSGAGLSLALQGVTAAQAEAMTPYLARQTPLAVQG